MRRLCLMFALVLGASSRVPSGAVTEPPPEPIHRGLYEWMGVAPIVIAGDVVTDDGRFVEVVVKQAIKGGTPAGTSVLVDLRTANRDRDPTARALKLDKGVAYLFLLQSSHRGRGEPAPVFDLVRGVQGARVVPTEGRDAMLDAASRLAAIQERHDDALLWATLPSFLEDDNPVLLDATLDLYVKFQRADTAVVPMLDPLVDHPRPDIRERAVLLLGRILARVGPADPPERSVIVGEITGRARRDDEVTVRRTAVAALAPLPDAGIDETLRAIARDDKNQEVRYQAERSLYERAQAGATRSRGDD